MAWIFFGFHFLQFGHLKPGNLGCPQLLHLVKLGIFGPLCVARRLPCRRELGQCLGNAVI